MNNRTQQRFDKSIRDAVQITERARERDLICRRLRVLAEWFDNPKNPAIVTRYRQATTAGTALRTIAALLEEVSVSRGATGEGGK